MSNLYLHIGMPKTGTTTIQKFLRNNTKVLEKNGFAYPIFQKTFQYVDNTRNGHFLKFRIFNHKGKRDIDAEQNLYEEHFKILSQLSLNYENILLSEESLWTDKQVSWQRIKDMASNINLNVKLIVYLRRQDSFIQSLWSQKVKIGYTETFELFLKSDIFKNYDLDYFKKLEQLSSVFGKENIIVRVYEKSNFKGTRNTLTSDFLDAIGLTETDEYIHKKEFINPSLSGVYLDIKRMLNNIPELAINKSFASKLLANLMTENGENADFNTNQYFSYKEQKKFLKQYQLSNKLVAKEYLNKSDGVLFTEKITVNKNKNTAQYEPEELIKICGEMLIKQNNEIEKLKKKHKDTK